MYPYKDIVDQIKIIRKQKGVTQVELAKLTGLKQAAIARIENHHMSPTINMLNRILDSLGMVLNIENYKKINKHLTIVLDMHGCPNRCRHCWLGDLPNNQLDDGYADFVVKLFKPYFEDITFYSWLREPDFCHNYQERWIEDNNLSTIKPQRFELASFYKIVKDTSYVKWLKEVGTKKIQLTFFGLEKTTDEFVGRVGAYDELIKASKILKENDIEPKWQIFIYETNKDEVVKLIRIAQEMDIKDIIVHEGSCEGNNRKLYAIRINKNSIPKEVIPYYLNFPNILSEKECIDILKDDESYFAPHNEEDIVINITSDLNIYFNFTNPSPAWKVGNIKDDDIDIVVRKIVEEDVVALTLTRLVNIKKLVKKYGDTKSNKVFSLEDYKMYLLNNYLDEKYNINVERHHRKVV